MDSMILVLGGEKGGSGKSCIAQNLAVWLQRQGSDVLLLDADPQGTSVDWAREREQNPDLQASRLSRPTVTFARHCWIEQSATKLSLSMLAVRTPLRCARR